MLSLGCFLIGIVFTLGAEKILFHLLSFVFYHSFSGCLTTFSTYGIESINLARSGDLNVSIAI
jgi:fluoride ion exporter CrcB/FEX